MAWTRFGGVGVLVVALAGCAGGREAADDATATVPGLEQRLEGVVVSVQDDVLAVRDVENPQGPAVRFQRDDDTELVRDGERVDWQELRQGTPVRVRHEPSTGPETAVRVEVLTGSEAQQVRQRAGAGAGWQRPEGVGRQPPPADPLEPGQGAPPPAQQR